MQWTDLIGYLAASLVFLSFYMKKMIPLRAVGASANVVFIIYASIAHVYPLLILHGLLFPLNITRMVQMMRLIKKVKEASTSDFSIDFLVPFMTRESYKKGDIVFRRGDPADKLYYLQKGLVRLQEIGSFITDGQLIGEIGLFSPNRKRTATVVCDADTVFLTIPENTVLQLYYQNPKFGIYLVQLIIKRFLKNMEEIKKFEGNENHTERRRVDRLNFKLPVSVKGKDETGKEFTEQTYFENVSPDGAYIIIKNPVSKETVLSVLTDNEASGLEIMAKVVRVNEAGGVNGYGVRFMK
ncbi:MAG: cyclic nucleotide-binding domain-containing protein [Deltaproteobacteria bacterium]|nr:cyclic nucleotide-binding domain-containing protein [Deltaproteobacteria bacterium]MBZ0219616.1 cyclic nucleotide-binding domain-containing protein [Deltaproteobacteria bacterium]